MVGVLADRRGAIKWVIVGDATRMYLPDIGRLRGSMARLRGLRLLVARPYPLAAKISPTGRRNQSTLSDDFRTDLEKLRLDAVVEIDASRPHFDGPLVVGYLGASSDTDNAHKLVVREHFYQNAHGINVSFSEFIEEVLTDIDQNLSAHLKKDNKGLERAILVGVYVPGKKEGKRSMDELHELARSARIDVVDEIFQYRAKKDPKTVVGLGKLEDICLHALSLGVEIIIFDCDLTPSQLLHITDRTDLKVLDRTMLILDIFAQRAVTKEGKIQVEMAQLSYSLPRLAQKQSGLSRLTGGIGGRGPGETKLEVDRRRVKEKLARLTKELKNLKGQRSLRRKSRQVNNVPTFAIVGYTNAGKSTLLNVLCDADIYAKDELFATLDPHSRRIRFPKEKEALITDTVGFIENLPPSLMKAFMTTLEELQDADVLLHVIDASDPNYARHMKVVNEVLEELNLLQKPRILVFNKIDKLADKEEEERLKNTGICISALHRQGLTRLIDELAYASSLNSLDSLSREEIVFDER